MNVHIPEVLKPVRCMEPQTMAATVTGDYVCLKNVDMAYIVAVLTQGNAATQRLSPYQATAVAGTAEKVLANAVPIWSNLDSAAADLMVKRTAAVSYDTDAGVKHKIVVMQIDPAMLDVANGFDCISVEAPASNAANLLAVYFLLKMRYAEDQAPAVITD